MLEHYRHDPEFQDYLKQIIKWTPAYIMSRHFTVETAESYYQFRLQDHFGHRENSHFSVDWACRCIKKMSPVKWREFTSLKRRRESIIDTNSRVREVKRIATRKVEEDQAIENLRKKVTSARPNKKDT